MNKLNIFKKVTLSLTSLVAAFFLSSGVVSAIAYDGAQTAASPVPAFNVFTGVPAPWGNENDFLRARVPINGQDSDATTQYTDPLSSTCKDGEKIQMRVYVHNGASATANNNGSGPSVAHGTKVKVSIPGAEATTFNPSASISATNAATVNDGVAINCNGHKVTLHYIAGSASQFSNGSGVVQLSDSIVTSGATIRSHAVDGDVWGCWDERVYVVLSVQVKEVPPVITPVSTLQCVINANDFTFDQKSRKANLKVTAQVTNATVTGYSINWGDNTPAAMTQSASHTYTESFANNAGKAIITADFTAKLADGTTKTVSGENCVETVTFAKTPPVVTPPVTPPVTPAGPTAPTILVNTGAGSVIGLFAATSAIGAIAYRWFLGRRLNSN